MAKRNNKYQSFLLGMLRKNKALFIKLGERRFNARVAALWRSGLRRAGKMSKVGRVKVKAQHYARRPKMRRSYRPRTAAQEHARLMGAYARRLRSAKSPKPRKATRSTYDAAFAPESPFRYPRAGRQPYAALRQRSINKVNKTDAQLRGRHGFSVWAVTSWGGRGKTPRHIGFFDTYAEAEAAAQADNAGPGDGDVLVIREYSATGKILHAWSGFKSPKVYQVRLNRGANSNPIPAALRRKYEVWRAASPAKRRELVRRLKRLGRKNG
jgi:hypothetical protein